MPLAFHGIMFEVERRTATTVEVVVQIPEHHSICDFDYSGGQVCVPGCGSGSTIQTTYPLNLSVDSVNGALYIAVHSKIDACVSLGDGFGIVKVSGLPTVLDVVPEGSPGPQGPTGTQGPIGPQGLPGTPADPSQVLALQGQVSALEAQVGVLQTTLQQIESLPIIKRLLSRLRQSP